MKKHLAATLLACVASVAVAEAPAAPSEPELARQIAELSSSARKMRPPRLTLYELYQQEFELAPQDVVPADFPEYDPKAYTARNTQCFSAASTDPDEQIEHPAYFRYAPPQADEKVVISLPDYDLTENLPQGQFTVITHSSYRPDGKDVLSRIAHFKKRGKLIYFFDFDKIFNRGFYGYCEPENQTQ